MKPGDKLTRRIRIPLLIITLLFSVTVITSVVLQNHNKTRLLISHLHQDYLARQKEQLRSQVEQFTLQTEYNSKKFYKEAARSLQQQVETALDIANTICAENEGKTREEIVDRIVATLRNIRFKKDQGLYFIYTPQGQAIMVPNDPGLEGNMVWDRQDANGLFFVRKLITHALAKKSEPVSWSLKRSYDSETNLNRIGYSSYFDKCDIIIGAEENTEVLQKKLLEESWKRHSHHYDHLFVMDNKKEMIVEPVSLIQDPSLCLPDKATFSLLEAEQSADGESFLRYNCDKQKTALFLQALPGWQWTVGAIEKEASPDTFLADKIALIKQQNRLDNLQLLINCLLVTVGVAWLSFYLSQRANSRVYREMMFDNLTGLPNRSSFVLQLESEIQAGNTVAILDMDIDDFSTINERFNRQIGDQLLCQIVDRLRAVVDGDNHLCRVAGDEFLLCFEKVIPCELGEIDVLNEISAVRAVLLEPFLVGDEKVHITCAIGAVCSGGFRSSINDLLRRANIMLFRAKSEGKNRYSCYNSSIEKVLQRDTVLEKALVNALSNDEIHIVYQPQINSQSGRIDAVEALCRWTSVELGIVSPEEFIPVAEKNGFILPLGYYILRKACRDILQWRGNGEDPVNISINISPRQLLHSNFIPELQKIIGEVGIAPQRVTIEITENLLFTDVKEAAPVLRKLDTIGFDISLDDFGTGASSLTHIHQLPIGELKIDRSFVMNMFSNSQTKSLIKSILAVSRSNRLRIVAEGVEAQEHADWLKKHNCDLLQGYFFSGPLTIAQLREKYPSGTKTG